MQARMLLAMLDACKEQQHLPPGPFDAGSKKALNFPSQTGSLHMMQPDLVAKLLEVSSRFGGAAAHDMVHHSATMCRPYSIP